MKSIKILLYSASLIHFTLSCLCFYTSFNNLEIKVNENSFSNSDFLVIGTITSILFLINLSFSVCFSLTLKKFNKKENEVSSLIELLQDQKKQQAILMERLSE